MTVHLEVTLWEVSLALNLDPHHVLLSRSLFLSVAPVPSGCCRLVGYTILRRGFWGKLVSAEGGGDSRAEGERKWGKGLPVGCLWFYFQVETWRLRDGSECVKAEGQSPGEHSGLPGSCLLLSILYALIPQSVVLRPAGMASPGACPTLAHWPYPRPARAESVLHEVTKEVMEVCCLPSLVIGLGTWESTGEGFNKREFLGPYLRLSNNRPGLWPEWV